MSGYHYNHPGQGQDFYATPLPPVTSPSRAAAHQQQPSDASDRSVGYSQWGYGQQSQAGLDRQASYSTVSPYDSASNWGGNDTEPMPGDPSHMQYQHTNYLAQDPYARASQASFGPPHNPYDDVDDDDHQRDHSSMPLVPNAAVPGALGFAGAAAAAGGGGRPQSTSKLYVNDYYGAAAPYDSRDSFQDENKYPPSVPGGSEQKLPSGENVNRGSGQGFIQELEKARADRPPVWQRLFRDTTPTEDRIYNHQHGIGVQRRPWVCWILTVGMIVAMITQMGLQWSYTGAPIAIKPQFNPMIGPSGEVLINTGARFVPCMKEIPEIIDMPFGCLNNTQSPPEASCSLEEICGFGGWKEGQEPDQSFRFILPVFIHAGLVHILLNLLAQNFSSSIVEKEMGSLRFTLLYIPAGVFGFILGANFALVGQPSVGASGAIFGTHGAFLVDLLAHWSIELHPKKKLLFLVLEIVIGFGIGFIPNIDNWSHIGGFAMGTLLAIIFYPVIHQTRKHRITFYVLRAIALPGVLLLFVLLVRNFYTDDPSSACSWCRYLSCWPTDSNNHCKGTGLKTRETDTTSSLVPVVPLLVGQWLRSKYS